MKAFISWSGELSHQVALELRRWIPTVVQAVDAWCSSEDIPKGAHWPSELARELDNASFGILCITRGNMTEPWINFEAGALSKALAGRRVSPFMFGLEPRALWSTLAVSGDPLRKGGCAQARPQHERLLPEPGFRDSAR
jgi:hypothetical protein